LDLIRDRQAARRTRVLEAARELIAECGYTGVTMRGLATASRVSIPTLYALFGGKDQLLYSAVESHFLELMGRDDESARAPNLPPVMAVVERCASEALRLAHYNRALIRFFIGSDSTPGLHSTTSRAPVGRLEAALEEMQGKRQLASWAEPRIVAEQIADHCIMNTLEWAAGRLDDDALGAGMSYGACLILLGLTRGRIRTAIERHAQEMQAPARKPSRVVESNPSTPATTRRKRRSTRARPSVPKESRQ
jgi:AcrR family transcriptional regulator